MEKLISKKIEHIVRGDNTEEFKIKYIYSGWFNSTEVVYDPIIFHKYADAEVFINLSIRPSKKLECDAFKSYHIFRNRNMYRMYTIYDDEIKKYSVSVEDAIRQIKNRVDIKNKDPYYVMYSKYDNHFYLIKTQSDIYFDITPYENKPVRNYQSGLWETVSKSAKDNIIDFIDNRKKEIQKQLDIVNAEETKKKLHDTIISVKEIEFGVDDEMISSDEMDNFMLDLETKQIYEERNEVIQKELDRIDRYKNRLLSLMH